MSYQLTIEPIGQTIEIGDDQTILDACMRAGVWLPHACCHGLCATCKVQVLDGEGAVLKYRDVMGATDPSKAADGTIRKVHAKSIGENSVHGSDAPETAAIEIAQFFSGNEIVG